MPLWIYIFNLQTKFHGMVMVCVDGVSVHLIHAGKKANAFTNLLHRLRVMVSPGKNLSLVLFRRCLSKPLFSSVFNPSNHHRLAHKNRFQRNEGIYLEIHIRVSMIGNGWMAFVRVRIPSWPAKKCFKCIRVIVMAWERKKMNTLVKYLLIHSECCCYSCRGQKIKQHTNDAYKKSAGRIFDSLCFRIGKLGKTRCYSLARSEIATLQVDAHTKRGEIFVRHLKNSKMTQYIEHWSVCSCFLCVFSPVSFGRDLF